MKDTINIFITLFILISPVFNGLYFENQFIYATLALLLIFILQLVYCKLKNKRINFGNKKILILFLIALIINVCTYAINRYFYDCYYDYSIIIYGLIQMVEMILFYLVIIQDRSKESIKTQNYAVIVSGVFMTLLAFLPEFYRNGRFEGTFNYANSLAIFLFICFALTIKMKLNKALKVILSVIFTIGIILTNSRFTYVIYIMFLIVMMFNYVRNKVKIKKNENIKKYVRIALIIAGFLIISLCMYVTNNEKAKDRFSLDIIQRDVNLKLSYFDEANDIIGERPFGLGYEGYTSNQEIKENKYRLRLVHNFLYQWTLNYGIGMLILGITLIIYYIILCIKNKKLYTYENLIIALILFHSLQDISLSFLVIDNIIIMLCIRCMYKNEN